MCFKSNKDYKITEKLIGQVPIFVEFPVTKKHIRFILVFKENSNSIYFWIAGEEHVSIKWSYWGEEEWKDVNIGGGMSLSSDGKEEFSFRELILFDHGGSLIDPKIDNVILVDIQRKKDGPGKFSVRSFDEFKVMIQT